MDITEPLLSNVGNTNPQIHPVQAGNGVDTTNPTPQIPQTPQQLPPFLYDPPNAPEINMAKRLPSFVDGNNNSIPTMIPTTPMGVRQHSPEMSRPNSPHHNITQFDGYSSPFVTHPRLNMFDDSNWVKPQSF